MAELRNVAGLSKCLDNLKKLPDKLRKQTIGKATRKGAEVIRDQARENAPVFGGKIGPGNPRGLPKGAPPAGTLRKEIIYKQISEKTTHNRVTYYVLVRRKKGNAWYWFFVEFGTAYQAPQHFLRDAFTQKAQEAIDVFKDTLIEGVREMLPQVKG